MSHEDVEGILLMFLVLEDCIESSISWNSEASPPGLILELFYMFSECMALDKPLMLIAESIKLSSRVSAKDYPTSLLSFFFDLEIGMALVSCMTVNILPTVVTHTH